MRALAKEHLGIEQSLELLLHQSCLGGAGMLVMTEEAREPLGAVAVTSPRDFEHRTAENMLVDTIFTNLRDCRSALLILCGVTKTRVIYKSVVRAQRVGYGRCLLLATNLS